MWISLLFYSVSIGFYDLFCFHFAIKATVKLWRFQRAIHCTIQRISRLSKSAECGASSTRKDKIKSPRLTQKTRLLQISLVKWPSSNIENIFWYHWSSGLEFFNSIENWVLTKEICSNLVFCVNLGLLTLSFLVEEAPHSAD